MAVDVKNNGSSVFCVRKRFPPLQGEGQGGDGVKRFVMIGQTNKMILKNKLQRNLRRNMTDAERLLWQALRNKHMAGLKFRRQHPFEDFILDFVCLEKRLVVELDGGQHSENKASDKVRTEKLVNAGFHVLRFWNHEVLGQTEAVKERIWLELQKPGEPHPHLNPLPEGEEINKLKT
ncbi:MAG: endonuclease domain-containing protein [Deltaproteobacteria bacterium]|nr:endonuclease domain-containing protein [Deltaproteobacteria bacterium]